MVFVEKFLPLGIMQMHSKAVGCEFTVTGSEMTLMRQDNVNIFDVLFCGAEV
jgi:hypothetical protein